MNTPGKIDNDPITFAIVVAVAIILDDENEDKETSLVRNRIEKILQTVL